ncbi:MAG: hypothetical protein IJ877_07785 [Candidatus Gastranaerophilales bacterium]|nr:hypothetical protein [Candidatus Gastranaerophilales bacterium]
MKKAIILFTFLLLSLSSLKAQELPALNDTNREFILANIDFQNKLKNCEPAVFYSKTTTTEIIGMKNNSCNFISECPSCTITSMKTGKAVDISHCNYNAPISAVRTYANNNIKLLKYGYMIDDTELNTSQVIAMSDFAYKFSKLYCK